jgi:spermidine synthase
MSEERVLAARHTGFNHVVVTENRFGVRTLRFGHEGVCQSMVKPGDPEHLELPYTSVLPLCLAFVEAPRRALILGLGGGALPMFLHRCLPDLDVEVVELDPGVLEVAREFFGFIEDARLCVWIEDGRDFIERHTARYDLVILDGFDAEAIPRHLRTLEFLESVKLALAPGGIAVANVWGRSFNTLYANMLRTYSAAFEELYVLDVEGPGTKIFIACPGALSVSREQLAQRAGEISKRYGFRHPLGDSLTGFRAASEERCAPGAVLRDP